MFVYIKHRKMGVMFDILTEWAVEPNDIAF